MKVVDEHLDGVVGGAVVHHDDLVELIVQLQQGFYAVQDGDLLVVGGNQDGDGEVEAVLQLVFDGAHPVRLVEMPGPDGHRQEEAGGVEQQIEEEKCLYYNQGILDKLAHTAIGTSFSSFSAWPPRMYLSISAA